MRRESSTKVGERAGQEAMPGADPRSAGPACACGCGEKQPCICGPRLRIFDPMGRGPLPMPVYY